MIHGTEVHHRPFSWVPCVTSEDKQVQQPAETLSTQDFSAAARCSAIRLKAGGEALTTGCGRISWEFRTSRFPSV